jgi:translation initiation factor IF-2
VKSPAGDVVFLDTPGHEAFTSLRARGANVTDLVILVVAADDGVMPQTVEAIQHAQAAKVPIIVAVNKIDRPNADVDRVKRQLMEHQLVPEEFGGETIYVPLSAKTGQGIPQLLEYLHLQAEVLELKAPHVGPARGSVIESKMDRRRGPVSTVIVQRGTLSVGDHFVVGHTYGRVRAMFDDRGQPVEKAFPSEPVEILGFDELPQAGDPFVVMSGEKLARELSTHRAMLHRGAEAAPTRRAHLEDFLQGAAEGEVVTLHVVLKTDTQGSLEALRMSLDRLGNQKANVNLVRAGIGGITETDVSLAATTNSIVIGFNVRPEAKAAELAQREGIDVKLYTIIYELIDDVKAALQGMLKPLIREQVIGHLEVRGVFPSPKDGQIIGGFVTDGKLQRNSFFRLFRDNVLVHTGTIGSLRRFKDDVSEVQQGFECGMRVMNYTEVRAGDLIEAFIKVEEKQLLDSVAQA